MKIIRDRTVVLVQWLNQNSRAFYPSVHRTSTKGEKYSIIPEYQVHATVINSRLAFSTGDVKKICKYTVTPDERYSMLGLDTHADISCAGRDAHILAQIEGKTCSVHPFNDSYEPMKGVNMVNVLYKYENCDGEQYVLEVNQCLDFSKSMTHSILCTNQVRHNGVIVNDTPKICDRNSTQDIKIPKDDISLPLEMNGPIPYLPISKPTQNDIEWLPRITITSEEEEWDPQFIFNGRGTNLYSYLENDFDISYNVQGLTTLHEMVDNHEIRFSALKYSNSAKFTPDKLAKLWGIGFNAARRTLSATTQLSTRYLNGKIHRRVRTRMHQRRYRQLWGHLSRFSSDTFKSKVRSLRGNQYFQLFCNKGAFTKVYSLKGRSEAHLALNKFLHEIGIPSELHTDGAGELVHGEWDKLCQKYRIYRTFTEPHSPWQNIAERAGGIIKSKTKDMMRRTNTPLVLWDYCTEYNTELRCMTATSMFDLNGRTPFETVLGFTPDISELVEFDWYQWVWYHDPVNPHKDQIGRWLGPAHNVGQGLAYYVLNPNAEVIVRSTVSAVNEGEMDSHDLGARKTEFTNRVESLIGNFQRSTIQRSEQKPGEMVDIYSDLFELTEHDHDELQTQEFDELGNPSTKPEADNIIMRDAPNAEIDDKWINTQVPISQGGEIIHGIVKRRKRDGDSDLLIGNANSNPILDTRVYEVEMPDGTYADYQANNLIENLMNNVDDDGRTEMIMDEILDHRTNEEAVPKEDGWVQNSAGTSKRAITTKGWDIKVQWSDSSTNWVPLRDIKESNPIEVAEYAIRTNIADQPAFAWWAPQTVK